jgi:hypothetical protein
MLVGYGGAATTISGENGARNGRIWATASQDSAAIMGLWRRYRATGMSCEVTMGLRAADGAVATACDSESWPKSAGSGVPS